MNVSRCPYCTSEDIEWLGYSDGAGDYGDRIGEDWECHGCGIIFTPRTWPIPEELEIDWFDNYGEET